MTYNWVLSSEEFEVDVAAASAPPEVFFGACDEAGAEGEGGVVVPVAPVPFSTLSGSTLGEPGLILLLSNTLRGRTMP
jgi:hypothetical protein